MPHRRPAAPGVARRAAALRLVVALVGALLVVGVPAAQAQPGSAEPSIVKLRDGADVQAAVADLRSRLGVRADQTFRRALRGYAARLTPAQAAWLRRQPQVEAVVADAPVELAADPQPVPPGIRRVGASPSAIRAVDGSDPELDVDIAIIDTGIADHPDLNIAGGYNCTSANRDAWGDENTHGTHVAGAAAARDNGFGVVGVAPGARVWAVKVMDVTGGGLVSWLICGIDWVAAQADPAEPNVPLFEVANMSLSVRAGDDGNCGQSPAPTAWRRRQRPSSCSSTARMPLGRCPG
jgi:subtilisin